MKAITALTLLFCCSVTLAEEPLAKPSPAEQLKQLQGTWKVTWSISRLAGQSDPPVQSFLTKLLAQETTIHIDGQKLLNAGKQPTAQLLNDPTQIVLTPQRAEQLRYDTLLQLTLPEGQQALCSYHLSEAGFSLHYPAGCCSRSGTMIRFAKVNE